MKVPAGFLFSGIHSGIKKKRRDLGMIYCEDFATGVGFFTNNANPSYSVILSKRNIGNKIKAVLVNSGNANCFTHRGGLADTQRLSQAAAGMLNVHVKNILIASTGVIGRKLPLRMIVRALPAVINHFEESPCRFAESILTTDTHSKISSGSMSCKGKKITVLGIAKGAGMISPHMATMLAFVLTDAAIERRTLQVISRRAVQESFNSITVDGCMSTNDSVYVLSSGVSSGITGRSELTAFEQIVSGVFLELAKMVVHDAEGATKFITISVEGALTKEAAQRAAFTLADSVLLKTALYGQNPNWGRIVAALGQAGVKVQENVLKINATPLAKAQIQLRVKVGGGRFSKTVYTSDLTPEYVRINAGYS